LDPGLDLLVARAGMLTAHPLPVKTDTKVGHLNRQPEPLRLRRVQRKFHILILRQALRPAQERRPASERRGVDRESASVVT